MYLGVWISRGDHNRACTVESYWAAARRVVSSENMSLRTDAQINKKRDVGSVPRCTTMITTMLRNVVRVKAYKKKIHMHREIEQSPA